MHKNRASSYIDNVSILEVLVLFSALSHILPKMIFMTSYVTNTGSFAKPLSSDEEQRYLQMYKNGDKSARDILIERNLRLVAHIVKKYDSSPADSDDLISIGTIGLIKAVSSFNPDKGTRLATYAARCIENEILMSLRAAKKKQNEVPLQDPVGIDSEGKEISLIDKLGTDGECVFDEVESKMQIRTLYEKMHSALQNRERQILEMRYGLRNRAALTQKEIAKALNISRSYVSRIEKKAVKKLADSFEV